MLSTFQLPKFTMPDFETLKKLCVNSIKMLRGWCLGKLPVSLQFIGLISAYIFVVGIIECAVQYHFHLKSLSYFNSWTIGFRPQDGAAYNRLFFSYLVGIFGILGGVIYVQTLNYLPKCRAMLEWISERIWGFILGGAIILAFITPYFLAVFCFKLVIGLLVCRLLLEVFPKFETAPVTKHQKYIGLSLVLCGMVAASLWMCVKAWYPVKLANDYLELPTSITIPATPNQRDAYLKMDVSVAMGCLLDPQGPFAKEIVGETTTVSDGELDVAARYSRNPSFMDQLKRAAPENAREITKSDIAASHNAAIKTVQSGCPHLFSQYQSDLVREPLLQTEFWQSQAGRTLYHHSYIYIPAVHFLKYGLSAPIPYLYGLGNTVFHAMLMNGKALTLTTYFETYPVAQLTGILIIVGAIFYMTRSLLTVPLAFALLLMPLMQIEFEAIQLAPGFNPLRYAGLVLQLTSVVYLFRRPNFWRSLMLLAALAVSLVWNKEFALLGLFCQVLALFMPQLSVSLRSRITAIVVAGTIALVGMYYLNQLSVGYLETIQAGLFGVAVPAIKLNHFIQICMGVVVYSLVLFFISKTHEGNERIARLCLIPIMWLLMIKFIYNASYAHMLYSLSFVFPLSLVFWNWQRQDDTLAWFGLNENQRKSLVGFACVVISLGCLLLAYEYKNAAKRREDMLLTYYEKDTWNQLGESFVSTAPAAPIEDRMKALQDELKPNDRVVFLSPFDHLMSFYGNPEKYCGHFEYLTNLVTYDNVSDVISCIKQNPDALVVYDSAILHQCPVRWHVKYFVDDTRGTIGKMLSVSQGIMDSCEAKNHLFGTMQTIMDAVKPDLVLVKKVGTLSFYRHAVPDTGVHK